MELKGLLFVLVGPSGSGKNTLINDLREHNPAHLRQLPTATTRPKRPNETHGVEHFFLSDGEFQELIRTNALVEYQLIHNAGYYGTPRAEVEKALATGDNLLADIDIYGAEALKHAFPDNVVLIFISPPDQAALETRIRERKTNTDQEIQRRLARADMEMSHALRMDYVVINDDFEKSSKVVREIVVARCNGSPIETQIPVKVCAWVTRQQDDGRVLVMKDHLPCYRTPSLHEAMQTIQQCLEQDFKLQAEPVGNMHEHALYIHHLDGQLIAELIIPMRVVDAPDDLIQQWNMPENLAIPFHVKARFAPQTATLP